MPANNAPAQFQTPLAFRAKQVVRKVLRNLRAPKVVERERLVIVDESGRCENPIFLIGVHRSGTTLLRRIVDSHSRIACPPETFFLVPMARLLEAGRFQQGLTSMGFDREGIARGLRRGADYFYNAYCQSKGKPRWADKTPEYVRILPFVEEVFGPGCQYLVIYRHPFDVVNSLLSSGWDFSMEQWHCLTYHEDWYTNVLMYHADVLQRQLDFEAAHPDRCFRILYEKLVAEPEEVLRGAFEFLGESWEPQVLAHHEQQHDSGTEDPHAAMAKGFRPSVGNWKGWSKEQIEVARETLAAQMEQLGYDAEF